MTGRAVSWLGILCFVVGLVILGSMRLREQPTSEAEVATAESRESRRPRPRRKSWLKPEPSQDAAAHEQERIETADLGIHLVSTVISNDPPIAEATIGDADGKHQTLEAGDSVLLVDEELLVEEIERGRVILDQEGQLLELRVPKVAPQADTPEEEFARLEKRVREHASQGNAHEGFLAFQREQAATRTAEAFEDGLEPRFDSEGSVEDRLVGFEVARAPSNGSFLDQLGLQGGDVIEEVNDIRVDGDEEADAALAELAEASSLHLVIRREQETIELWADAAPTAIEPEPTVD